MLGDYWIQELDTNERIIYQNDNFVVLVPFWAVWPFETMIITIRATALIDQLTGASTAFADAILRITKAYDALFNCYFPYF